MTQNPKRLKVVMIAGTRWEFVRVGRYRSMCGWYELKHESGMIWAVQSLDGLVKARGQYREGAVRLLKNLLEEAGETL
jgi:hypothetical protein